jgi:hypothetical protein
MSNDLTKRNDLTKQNDPTKPGRQEPAAINPASRLKGELMADALERMLGKEAEKPIVPGTPRVLLALANHWGSPGWDYAKVLQRQMFDASTGASAGGGLQMKFAYFGPDNDAGVRRFRITTRWISDADEMAGLMDRAECNCGCYVHICSVLEQAVKENADRPMRAVVVVGDAFHDSQDSLDEAALSAIQLRRAGTKLFLVQEGNDPATAQAAVFGQGLRQRLFPVRSEDAGTAIRGDVESDVGLCFGRRGGRESDGRASGGTAAGAPEAGADAGYRGA